MLTTNGKLYIKKFMAGQVSQIARAISFGVGSSTPTANDQLLQFEIGRAAVSNVFYDYNADKIIYKAEIPTGVRGVISEIGLWSDLVNSLSGAGTNRIITTFEDRESWSLPITWSNNNTKIGVMSVRQAPGPAASVYNEVFNLATDLSLNSAGEKFIFAYNNTNTNTASVVFKFKTDAGNYFSATFTNPTAGYHFDTILKSACAVTGTPNWETIQSIEVITTSKAGVSSTVDFDGITICVADSSNPRFVMVARQLETPFTVIPGVVNEIEFPLGVTIG